MEELAEKEKGIALAPFEKRKAAVLQMLEENEYIRNLELSITELDDSHAVGRIPYRENLLNPYHTVHGGCLYALADIVTGTLANLQGYYTNTVNGSMNYLEPAWKTQYVTCYATLVRCGRNLVTVHCELKADDGKILDEGSFTFFRTGNALTKEEQE